MLEKTAELRGSAGKYHIWIIQLGFASLWKHLTILTFDNIFVSGSFHRYSFITYFLDERASFL